MINIVYTGPFKVHLQNHVQLKKAIGYKYDTDAAQLKRQGNRAKNYLPQGFL